MRTEIDRIVKLYKTKELCEEVDESGTEGFWDLADEIAGELINWDKNKIGGLQRDIAFEQLQTGIYQMFQKIFIEKNFYE